MKKISVILMLILILNGCSFNKREESSLEEDLSPEEIIFNDLNGYIEDTVGINSEYNMNLTLTTNDYEESFESLIILSNPKSEVSLITLIELDNNPTYFYKGINNNRYYQKGLDDIEETTVFTLKDIRNEMRPYLTVFDIFDLFSQENIKSYEVNNDYKSTIYTLRLYNHDVLDIDKDTPFLGDVSDDKVLDRKLIFTVKDNKVFSLDYKVIVSNNGNEETVEAKVSIGLNSERILFNYVTNSIMIGEPVPFFIKDLIVK